MILNVLYGMMELEPKIFELSEEIFQITVKELRYQ